MLANVVPPTNDFHALARYLVNGKAGTKPSPKRIAWTLAHNLPTDDPDLAATYMTATAQLSPRTKNAAYHAMIAWHAKERPSVEAMQAIALQTLDLAGLAEHQALIMGHGDKPHAHLHMLINRVHPETGKAWATSHDYRRLDAIMRQLSDEHGFLYVPAHRFNLDLTDEQPKKPGKRATFAAKSGANTDRLQWSKRTSRGLGHELTQELPPGAQWEDVQQALQRRDIHLERKGRGFVVGNAAGYAKLSSLGLATTAAELEKRFGGPYSASQQRRAVPSRPWFAVDAVDIVQALRTLGLADKDDVGHAIDDTKAIQQAGHANAPLAIQMLRDVVTHLKATTILDDLRRQDVRSSKDASLNRKSQGPRAWPNSRPAR